MTWNNGGKEQNRAINMKTLFRNLALAALFFWAAAASAENKAADNKLQDPARFVSTSISITGSVENRITLTEADLAGLPQEQITETQVVCQSGADKGTMKNVTAVRLRDLLEKAKIKAEKHFDYRQMAIIAKAKDDYWVVYSWGELFNSPTGDNVYVYFRKNGQPLGDDEGRFALISTTDVQSGARQVKWLSEVEVRKIPR